MKKLIYLIVILTLNFSCKQKYTEEDEVTTELVNSFQTDSLTFTSGIRSIFEDSRGNYWFGSLQEGCAVYDGKSFTYYTTNEGLADNQILSIQEDENGIIWLGTQRGVNSVDVRLPSSMSNNITNHTPKMMMEFQHKWEKSDKDLWFAAGIKEGIYRYDGQRLSYLAFPNPKVINPNNLYATTSISTGKGNILWIGTYAGIFGFNGSDFTIINDETLGLDIESEPLHIRSLLEDSKGRLWIGNNGIGVLLKEGDRIINFSERNNLIHPTSTRRGDKSKPGTLEHVFTIAEDSRGNIWFGDRDAGIWKYNGQTMTNYTKKDGLTNDCALSIYQDKKGVLWFGMANGNVFKFIGGVFEKQF